ncbi:MAG: chlorophyll synthase ChlG [Pseudomonadota bacterium]
MRESSISNVDGLPSWSSVVELLKPVTWFPPMWAFACGVVASGIAIESRFTFLLGGVLLAGPFLCGTSQVVNDWYDRHVDAINEPNRPIPSGRVSVRFAWRMAIVWSFLSMGVAALLGIWVFAAAGLGLALAWAYSAPPLRLKKNGWLGNTACGLCYEGLPWFTAAAVMSGGLPSVQNILLALLYSFGAHGIMTLNDFKSINGDRAMGLKSLPAMLGPRRAARLACAFMLIPQLIVATLLWHWQLPIFAGAILAIATAQAALMPRLLSDPEQHAPWYNATGISLFVSGMMVCAFALRSTIA